MKQNSLAFRKGWFYYGLTVLLFLSSVSHADYCETVENHCNGEKIFDPLHGVNTRFEPDHRDFNQESLNVCFAFPVYYVLQYYLSSLQSGPASAKISIPDLIGKGCRGKLEEFTNRTSCKFPESA